MKLLRPLLCLGFLLPLSAMAGNFSLVPGTELAEKSLNAPIAQFLNNLDLRLENGIRFGVDRPVEIEAADLGAINPEDDYCLESNQSVLSKVSADQVVINQHLLPLISGAGLKLVGPKHCSLHQALVKSLEGSLISLKGADNLGRDLTRNELREIDSCEMEEKRHGVLAFRGNPSKKQRCREIKDLRDRRRRFESYSHQVKNVFHKVKMEFDPSSLTDNNLQRYDLCSSNYRPTKVMSNGKRIKVLGMAIVYMAPGYSTSVMGHVAERYVYCLDNKLVDFMFEYTQLTQGEVAHVEDTYKKVLTNDDPSYLNSLVGSIYMKAVANPASMKLEGYGSAQFYTNRDIIEIWPVMSEQDIYEGLQTSLAKFKEQGEIIARGERPEAYSLLHNNCTHPVRERLNRLAGEYEINNIQGFTPINIFGFLKKKTAERVIIYPSQRTLRRFEMLDAGKSLFWENTTLWSKSSDGKEGKGPGWMALYPETHGVLNQLIVKRAMGVANLAAGVAQVLYGIAIAPVKWLSKLFNNSKEETPTEPHLKNGLKGIGMSLSEIFPGVRMRYPKSTDWREEEQNFIYDELPKREPRILDYLAEKVRL
jgi:hypothetical protein